MNSIVKRAKKHVETNRKSAQRNCVSICKMCGERISWWDSPDNRPYNLDGSSHNCYKENISKVKTVNFHKGSGMTYSEYKRLFDK